MLPTGVALSGTFTFRKSGVLADPSPLPTAVSEGLYPDGSALTPLPALTHVSTGVFQATVFSAVQNASAGVHTASVYSADTTLDSQTSALYWEVDTSYLAAIFAYAASAVTTAGSAMKYVLDTLASILLKTNLLGASATTNIVSPIATDGTITVYLSRDFNSTDGLSIDIPVNVTLGASDTITWNAGPYGAYWLTVACTRLDANNARLQLTAANAASLNEGRSRYEVVVTPNGTTRKIEAAAGVLVVEAVIVA